MEANDGHRENYPSEMPSRVLRAARYPSPRSKPKDVAMFISVASSNRPHDPRPHDQCLASPEWVMGESQAAMASMSHNTVGGLTTTGIVPTPTRRISASSSLQSKVAPRRVSSKHQRSKVTDWRFGKPRKNVSKTVQSLQTFRNDLEQSQGGLKLLQTIATQTNDPDEGAPVEGIATAIGTIRRTSRIPVPREKPNPRDKTPIPSCAGRNSAEPCGNYALGNVYSLMTISVSETKLEDIYSSADLSVSVRPVLEAQESCTVSDVNILRLAEVKSKDVDVDRTLENWKPMTAEVSLVREVSLVPEVKGKSKNKKSNVKKDRSKDEISKKDDWPAVPGKVAVIDLDKEGFKVPLTKSKNSSRRERNGHEANRDGDADGGKDQSGSGSNFRVRFSPHLIAPSSAAASRERSSEASSTKGSSTANSDAAISKIPDLLKRVTDQAITSIAKSVILGLPQHLARYEPHPTSSFSNYHSPLSSPSFSGNYRPYSSYSRAPPMTMSTMNVHDDNGNSYRLPSRNASQLSVTSLINYPSNGGIGGNRYSYLAPQHRMSSNSIAKTRKEFDNRYSLHHQSSFWDAPGQRNSWFQDFGGSMYNGGEYGSRPGSPGSQQWLRYQKLRNRSGTFSTTSSSSSLYSPHMASKYERASQRFSLSRNKGGMRSSMENLHGSTMNGQAMESGTMGRQSEVADRSEHASFHENLYV